MTLILSEVRLPITIQKSIYIGPPSSPHDPKPRTLNLPGRGRAERSGGVSSLVLLLRILLLSITYAANIRVTHTGFG